MRKTKNSIAKRRKREGKTNYKKRLRMLLSNKPRLVIRPSNSNIIAQIIEYHPKGDMTTVSADSKELEKQGWKFVKGNIPAAYLTGVLLGTKAKKKDIKEAILDMGLNSSVKGSRIFACLKGVIDAGIQIPVSEDVFPDEKRIKGEHIVNYKSEKSDITKVFEEIKNKLIKVEK